MKNYMSDIKKWLIILVIVFSGIVIFDWYNNHSMKNTVKVCGEITGKSTIRGRPFITYGFIINGKKKKGSYDVSLIKKDISVDSMMKLSCIEIECSVTNDYFHRVIDSRIVKR